MSVIQPSSNSIRGETWTNTFQGPSGRKLRTIMEGSFLSIRSRLQISKTRGFPRPPSTVSDIYLRRFPTRFWDP